MSVTNEIKVEMKNCFAISPFPLEVKQQIVDLVQCNEQKVSQ